MRKKSAIMLSIMLAVGSLSILPMSGSAAEPHLFQAYDEATSTPMINNATDLTHPNDGLARMYNTLYPYEVVNTSDMQNWWYWNDTWDRVGIAGKSNYTNSFHLDAAGFNAPWAAGDIFVFTVEKDPDSSVIPMIYDETIQILPPNGYVASASIAITVDDFQVVGPMDLEKIPTPFFPTMDGMNYTINWTAMTVPNIGTYVIWNSSMPSGPWNYVEDVSAPNSTVYADSGAYYSIGINWQGGVMSLVQGAPSQFNTEPDLNWTGEPGFTGDGVSPDTGPADCRMFEYRVKYSDINNDAPQGGVPWVHILNSTTGVEIKNSTMTFDSWVGAANDYIAGALYTYTTTFTDPTVIGTTEYSYYFNATDIWGRVAIGDATVETLGPTVTTNSAPTIAVATPAGGESWTGGKPHDIFHTITDIDDQELPEFDMSLWLNYTTDGMTYTPIITLTDIPSTLSPYNWSVALIDSFTVTIRAEITDSCGVSAGGDSGVFEIDSTPPTVTFDPVDSSINVPITVDVKLTFIERMSPGPTQGAVLFNETDTGNPVTGYSLVWTVPNSELTLDMPLAAPLQQYTNYTVIVTDAALDDSDPGNALILASSTFRTEDLEPPEIVHTPVTSGETGITITISADVTDNVMVDKVYLNYIDTANIPHNESMSFNATTGNYTYSILAQTVAGTITYFIWANDTSNNMNQTQSFIIQVTKATCDITGKVVDSDGNPVEGATVEVLEDSTVLGSDTTDADGNFEITGLPCGNYKLRISKSGYDTLTKDIDTNNPDQGTLTLTAEGVFPWWILIVLAVIIIIIILLLVLLKRRKKPEEEEEAPPEEVEEEEAPEEEVVEEEVPEEEEEDLGLEELEDISEEEEKEGGE